MRKITVLTLSLFIGLWCNSQNRVLIPKSKRDIPVIRTYQPPIDDISFDHQKVNFESSDNGVKDQNENLIGTTYYDLQTNAALGNRISYYNDGTIGAVWMMGNNSPSFPDQGTGYNYFDGSSWLSQPTTRIESVRTCCPSYAPWGSDGEIVVAHDWAAGNLLISERSQKGQGVWNESIFSGPNAGAISIAWSRTTTCGANNNIIHLLALTLPVACGGSVYNGQDGALLYSRSQDGGSTWDIENQILPGTGSTNYNAISPDSYVWAEARGNTIAFVVANAWYDMFVMKSTDNGDTWGKTLIWQHPYPFFDWNTTVTDTFYCVDNSADIAINITGNVHLVFGISRVLHDVVGSNYTHFPYVDGIGYWNEGMPAFSNDLHSLDPYGHPDSELIEDYNLIGWTQDVNGNGQIDFEEDIYSYRELGISTMPAISIDNYNNVFLVYSSTTEEYDNGIENYKHIWSRGSDDGGVSWGNFEDLTDNLIHIFDECIYPVLAGNSDDKIHLIYQHDNCPGLAIDGDHNYYENRIKYISLDKSDLINYDPPTIINLFPYTESYETGFNDWNQSPDDDFDWTQWQGTTPSSGTGPIGAYHGSYYLYTEATDNSPYKTAGLYAFCDFSSISIPYLSYWYNMYGVNIGTLSVQVSTDNGTTWLDEWSLSGNQGEAWINNTINLSAYGNNSNVMIRFWALTGDGYRSDMAIDFVEIYDGSPPICTSPVYPQNLEVNIPVDATLQWNTSSNATGYILYFGTDNPPTNIENGINLGNATSYSPSVNLEYGTTYYWQIVPYNQFGNAIGCNVWQFETINRLLDLKVFLEGPYQGTYMSTMVNLLGYMPLDQPYNIPPWNYSGIENLDEIPTEAIVDWLLYELHDATDANSINETTLLERKAALLNDDGQITDLDGINLPGFNGTILNNLFVIIRHRNHLDIIAAYPLFESSGIFSYDFSANESKVLGGSKAHKDLGNGVWGMIAADGNADNQIDNRDKDDIWLVQQSATGYLSGDFNMDGQVNATDKDEYWTNNAGYGMQTSGEIPGFTCGIDFIDDRDGKTYSTIQIGSQCWMAENMNIGTMVNGNSNQTDNDTIEKYCYNNSTSNCDTYGGLYQWNEMMQYTTTQGVQGICPPDWHLPTDEEWKQLEGEVDSQYGYPDPEWNGIGNRGFDAGLNLKSTSGWYGGGKGTDLYGFTALPGGYLDTNGNFYGLTTYAYFWSSNESGSYAWERYLYCSSGEVYRNYVNKDYGFSVRCLKD